MTVGVDPDGRAPYCAGTGTLYGEPIQCLRRTTNPSGYCYQHQNQGESMTWVTHPAGLSAQAIAGVGTDPPWDPDDLLRCIRYCEQIGLSTEKLRTRMAGRSRTWDRLLPEWDRLVALLKHEMATRTDGKAPLTYIEMMVIRHGGVKCVECDGTGRGEPCPKCKGTGHRNGGRCRAERCARGAHPCMTCHGNGFTRDARSV